MRLLLVILMFYCTSARSESLTIGYLNGVHISPVQPNNSHPFVEMFGSVLIYKNSFDKTSFALYSSFGDEDLQFKVGITTGYKRYQEYRGYIYYQPFAINDSISIMFAPVVQKKISDNVKFIGALIGNSVNFGLGISF